MEEVTIIHVSVPEAVQKAAIRESFQFLDIRGAGFACLAVMKRDEFPRMHLQVPAPPQKSQVRQPDGLGLFAIGQLA